MYLEEIKREILKVSPISNQSYVNELIRKLERLNTADPEVRKIILLATNHNVLK